MKKDDIIEKIIKKTSLKKEDIERKVKEKVIELKGMSDDSAAFIIAKELGVELRRIPQVTEEEYTRRKIEEIMEKTGLQKEEIDQRINEIKERYDQPITDYIALKILGEELELIRHFEFNDEYEVKLKYSCKYSIEKERNSYQVICECKFQDFIPAAFKPEIPQEYSSADYQVHRSNAWKIKLEDIKDPDDYYTIKEWAEGIGILNGFTTSFRTSQIPTQEIDKAVKKWTKDLVNFLVLPQVKIGREIADGYVLKEIRPKNYFDMKSPIL